MNIPQSYIYFANSKNGYDQYTSALPIAERFGFADKPRQDASKAAINTASTLAESVTRSRLL